MGIVLSILILATLACGFMKSRMEQDSYEELKQRIKSWWVIIGLLFAVLLSGTTISIIFFAFLSFLALKEFLSIVPMRPVDRKVIFWAYLSIPLQYYWVSIEWYGMFIVFIPVYVFLFLPMRMVLTGDTKGFIRSAGVVHWACMLTVFSISHIAYLLVLPGSTNETSYEYEALGLVLFLLFMTQFNDVGQYVWGKLFGRHKIIPKVSPNKTWEGFIGGVATVTLCSAIIAPLLTPLNFYQGAFAGLLVATSGFVGDVVISSVKRDLQIKDSGSLIPGHGGILDRMDSLTYTSPLFFHFIYYVSY